MTPIKIEFADGFKVSQGDKYAEGLTFGEMMEVVIAATREHQRTDIPLAWMRTKEEWDKYNAELKAKAENWPQTMDVDFEEDA